MTRKKSARTAKNVEPRLKRVECLCTRLIRLLTPRTPSVDGWRLHIEENTTGTGLGGYSPENSYRFSILTEL